MKIKTKYNIDDWVMYKECDNFETANIRAVEIQCGGSGEISIKYIVLGYKNNVFDTFALYEDEILCKKSKRLMSKYLNKE